MAEKRFNNRLSAEIGNLFDQLGGHQLPDDARLDESAGQDMPLGPEVDIQALLERIKNLDIESNK